MKRLECSKNCGNPVPEFEVTKAVTFTVDEQGDSTSSNLEEADVIGHHTCASCGGKAGWVEYNDSYKIMEIAPDEWVLFVNANSQWMPMLSVLANGEPEARAQLLDEMAQIVRSSRVEK